MALVGMASKPLHVRRLQKALQEWVQNPGKLSFETDCILSAIWQCIDTFNPYLPSAHLFT